MPDDIGVYVNGPWNWAGSSNFPRYIPVDGTFHLTATTATNTSGLPDDKDDDMTKTPRNAYEFWVIDGEAIAVERIVAESAEQARDVVVSERLGGRKAKAVEIKLVRTEPLKPKVEA